MAFEIPQVQLQVGQFTQQLKVLAIVLGRLLETDNRLPVVLLRLAQQPVDMPSELRAQILVHRLLRQLEPLLLLVVVIHENSLQAHDLRVIRHLT